MKVDQATFAAHREGLLQAAGRLFRGRGLHRVSVADLCRDAGLTHGAFYGHYASKEAVAAASCRRGLADGAARWRARSEAAMARSADPVAAIIDVYLTPAHRDEPEAGCALAAIGIEAAREGGDVADALVDGTRGLLAVLDDALAASRPALDPAARERVGTGVLAVLVGGMVLARALRPDPARSAAALDAARLAARQLLPSPHSP
jgi:TetR/AcrR family transcriptional repressor of nem operon